ncbi:hypothetical protein SAMN02745246_02246 [Leeuwenhoekiella marinoflava DSM 3653]|uniref:Uncharacterized protein n=2 Tax=Leeuwenhoekiella marinoflava TaxID=988 RepID=A0A4Q0PL07_9FLAO|nr:hypothetical protein DSL99_2109 [Leeuwenhoekiella marinoflava]SHF33950.1 hypothetical protein SAMN02745246_02246 [Leeuwenhoekiella marinoflava DSM 3653]
MHCFAEVGTKMVELPAILLLSKAGVKKRNRNLKPLLEVEGQSDHELILNAKNRGFFKKQKPYYK